ncbi:hypothetical protein [Streptomyces yaizuensis]|uniref:Molecular chaperone DnaJ n=1 Tax=Streptomyces yaizuensis TaxID=2989713 RepID=A0ABQ5P2N8_9ACTN|nr:hypothetical protein [Streptomyces sp. YSPA8]GLF96740.1 hypothetical protein SYYSPA8_20605 [Streptomyces sp. YSPA8]
MMPQLRPRRGRICPDCDGFPVVTITTGPRHGPRRTKSVVCPTCHGTGTRTGAR